jgi:hypothetical protein
MHKGKIADLQHAVGILARYQTCGMSTLMGLVGGYQRSSLQEYREVQGT